MGAEPAAGSAGAAGRGTSAGAALGASGAGAGLGGLAPAGPPGLGAAFGEPDGTAAPPEGWAGLAPGLGAARPLPGTAGLAAGADGAAGAPGAAGLAGLAPGPGRAAAGAEGAAPAPSPPVSVFLAPPGAAPSAMEAKCSRTRRATGGSTVEEAALTNSPWSLSQARITLEVTFLPEGSSSLASSCTRGLATFLLSGYPPRTGVGASRGSSSLGTHRVPIGFLPAFAIDHSPTRAGEGVPVEPPAHRGRVERRTGAQCPPEGAPPLSQGEASRIRVDPGAAPGPCGPGIDLKHGVRGQDQSQELGSGSPLAAADAGALGHMPGACHRRVRPSVSQPSSAAAAACVRPPRRDGPATVRREVYRPPRAASLRGF